MQEETICKYNFVVIESVGGFPYWDSMIILCSIFIVDFVLSDKNLNRLINIDSPPLSVLLDIPTIGIRGGYSLKV